jgi:hypothetical protein
MMLGALIDAGVPVDILNRAIGSLGLPDITITAENIIRSGLSAMKADVHTPPEHTHRHLAEILDRINAAELTDRAKQIASNIFRRIAQAEARVHGTTVEKVHFHEVGAADSIADIVGVAVGVDYLNLQQITASPVALGSGTVEIAHGTFSVPVPAVVELLRGQNVPTKPSIVEAELTTPTGAAILVELVSEFGPMPAMTIDRSGYGAGSRDFTTHPNVTEILLGQPQEKMEPAVEYGTEESIWMLETNLDDTTGEVIGYCIERCWTAGALDVFTTPIQMKKNRPGVLLSVLCDSSTVEPLERILFEETTTLGVRRTPWTRRTLNRRPLEVETPYGPIQGKVATLPNGTQRFTPEYDSCRAAAESTGTPLQKIYDAANEAGRVRLDAP